MVEEITVAACGNAHVCRFEGIGACLHTYTGLVVYSKWRLLSPLVVLGEGCHDDKACSIGPALGESGPDILIACRGSLIAVIPNKFATIDVGVAAAARVGSLAFTLAGLWHSTDLPKKRQRGREEIVSTVGLDEGLEGGRGILALTVDNGGGQSLVLGLLGPRDGLAHDSILAWVGTTGELGLVGWEGIVVDPVLGAGSVSWPDQIMDRKVTYVLSGTGTRWKCWIGSR